ncbi:MAG TPA: hypothetical protein VF727_11940 [Allosphingosinicella sp.]|jgi:hypothetical protein
MRHGADTASRQSAGGARWWAPKGADMTLMRAFLISTVSTFTLLVSGYEVLWA